MRLIDADALITEAFDLMDRNELREDVPQIIKDYCDAQPTVDAVPVIRCRECKWYHKTYTWNGNEHMVCVELSGVGRSENDYCSRAERKDDD